MKKEKLKNQKGITLIALIVTIIVLLILAGISIATLTGNNGILHQANKTKNETEEKNAQEAIEIEVAKSSKDINNNKLNFDTVKRYLKMNLGVDAEEYGNDSLNVSYNGYEFKIGQNGKVSNITMDEDYKEIEYIESTGTQYIDTQYIPSINTRIEIELSFNGDFKWNGTSTSIFKSVDVNSNSFGVNFGTTQSSDRLLYVWADKTNSSGAKIYSFNVDDTVLRTKNTLSLESGIFKYGNQAINIANKTSNSSSSIVLFGSNSANKGSSAFDAYKMRVYKCRIYENNKLVKDYRPCYEKSTKKIGLYDMIDKKLYENNGTGKFNYKQ